MNRKLAYTVYRPESNVKAAVFIVHGMQEHQRRYKDFAEYLTTRGIGVVTYDLPGHGETDKGSTRGWFGNENGWRNLASSLTEICLLTKQEFPGVPVVCYGHSMGTMLARTFIQLHDAMIDALMLSGAPNYNPAAVFGRAIANQRIQARGPRSESAMLASLATGSFNSGIRNPRTPLDWLSYNEENVDRYIADEDCGFTFKNSGYRDLFDGMIQMADVKAFRRLNKNLPIRFFSGEDDPCTGGAKGISDSIARLSRAGYIDITYKTYPHMRHEILQEDDRATVYKDMADWILEKTAPEKA